jgi:hypothetical protein
LKGLPVYFVRVILYLFFPFSGAAGFLSGLLKGRTPCNGFLVIVFFILKGTGKLGKLAAGYPPAALICIFNFQFLHFSVISRPGAPLREDCCFKLSVLLDF